jgi:hypothetical protein
MPQTKKRDLVFAPVQRRFVDVPMEDLIPGLAFIRLQSLTAGELSAVRAPRLNAQSVNDLKSAIANEPRRLVVAAAIEDDGTPMFTLEDVIALGSRDAGVIDRLHQWAERHVTPVKTVEDIAKNSEETEEPSSQEK